MTNFLNENIRDLRTLRGLNQVEFATKLGVTKQCVSNWENDNVLPSIDMLVKIANFFNVSTDFLLGRTPAKIIDATNLTDTQFTHLSLLVEDFIKLNGLK
jgi:transcriptional regulator with XRE-family HTH domain